MLPEFEEGLDGIKTGEEKVVEVNFPEDYHGAEVAGAGTDVGDPHPGLDAGPPGLLVNFFRGGLDIEAVRLFLVFHQIKLNTIFHISYLFLIFSY